MLAGPIKDQRGILAIPILLVFLVIVLSSFSVLAAAAFGARKNAVVVYQHLQAAADFTVEAVSRERAGGDFAARAPQARRYFAYAFSRMLECDFDGARFVPRTSFPPGPVELVSFGYVPPGTAVPGSNGRATTAGPGYQAELKVPVLKASLPFLGPQYVTVPMRVVGVVRPVAGGN